MFRECHYKSCIDIKKKGAKSPSFFSIGKNYFTEIFLPSDDLAFGSRTFNTPLSIFADILSVSTLLGTLKVLSTLPFQQTYFLLDFEF